MKTKVKFIVILSVLFCFFTSNSFSQTDRAWWNSLTPAWKKVIQKQQFKGKDVTPNDEQLAEIAKMTFLELTGNKDIKSLKPAANLTLLEIVRCSDSGVESLEGLGELVNLKDLDCSDNDNIASLGAISNSYNLEKLNCGNTMVKSLTPLRNLKKLRILDVHYATVVDIRILKELRQLESLNVSKNASLFSLDGVNYLHNLTELYANETRIDNLSPVSNLKHLKIIEFADSPVNSLRPLQLIKSLEDINCSGTQIKGSSLEYLFGLSNIKMLRCKNIEISDKEISMAEKIITKKSPEATIIITSK